MIVCFPKPYPDELIYSTFARYYTMTGYLAFTYVAEDLYVKRTTRPNIEFLNKMTDDALSWVTRYCSIEDIVEKNTMFPYYGRFIKQERRQKAFKALISMEGAFYNLLAIPNHRVGYLRYCPLCVKDDRQKYGETYWHRVHQMAGVNICPKHLCKLVNSDVSLSSKQSPCLITAEIEVDLSKEALMSENKIEQDIAKYVATVFESPVNVDCNVEVGDFLQSRMSDTKYLYARGENKKIDLLYSDFSEYYKCLDDNILKEKWKLEKIFSNNRFNAYEICLLAMFLNIPANDLVNMKLPSIPQHQLFDMEIIRLHNMGLKYPEIAKRLNASYNIVKPIGEGRY